MRLASTGVLNGFMIFLTATFWLVSWSRAELAAEMACQQDDGRLAAALAAAATQASQTNQTRPKAPMPTGCRSEYLEVISKVVPKICALMNSAILCDVRSSRSGLLCVVNKRESLAMGGCRELKRRM